MRTTPRQGTARRAVRLLAALALLFGGPGGGEALAWGLAGHRIITAEAAARMPPEAGTLFETGAARLQEASLEPDAVWKGRDGAEERVRHYINLDALAEPPFSGFPRTRREAESRFGAETVRRNGVLPWRVTEMLAELEKAMRGGSRDRVLSAAGWLAHYAADLFEPLHLTSNFDGQKTCNQGIHKAFETELIESRREAYARAVARGKRAVEIIADPEGSILEWMRTSYGLVDKVLAADSASVRAMKEGHADYWESLDRRAGPIAQRQMSAAANAVASLWYTAWDAAGRPELR